MTAHTIEFHPETRGERVRRRLKTIPRTLALFVVVTLLFPLLVMVGLAVDLVRFAAARKPFVTVRLVAFMWVFLAAESWGLVRFFGGWVLAGFGRNRRRLVATAWPVQAWWARTLLDSVVRLFSIDLVVEGDDAIAPGPILAMFRHASIVDNLLPAVLVTDRHGIKLRWVIKKELLNYPGLDVGGNRLPNYFVDRDASDSRAEVSAIRRLGEGLGPEEGVLIYPEGTRFTEEKRTRALQRLASGNAAVYERAQRLRHVLPPRIGGPLILLDSGADVVLCGHTGLGGFARLGDIWSGNMVGRTVRVKFWRVAAADIPATRSARVQWLYDCWQQIDDWIAADTDIEAPSGSRRPKRLRADE